MSTAVLPTPAAVKQRPELVAAVELMRLLGPGGAVVLDGVSWDEYVWFDLRRDELRPKVKLAYADGRLEIMTTSFFHDTVSNRLLWVVSTLGLELNVPFRAGGRTTFRREDIERGLEPDECFYIQNVTAVARLREIDLTIHPPPDLAVEVDHTRTSLPKQPIYASLGVPELWRFDGLAVTFLTLQPDGAYVAQPTSRAFPVVNSDAVTRLVLEEAADDVVYLRAVQTWARTLVPQQP